MKKVILYSVGLALVAALASCGNAGMERKLERLEDRVNRLENGGRPAAPVATPTPEPTGPFAAFEFKETRHDFGTIDEGTIAEHEFVFTNTGEAPLIITEAQGSCGCTVPEYSKEAIPPGETGTILVKFNSQGRTGNQEKNVTLKANTSPAITRLTIRSQVTPANPAAE